MVQRNYRMIWLGGLLIALAGLTLVNGRPGTAADAPMMAQEQRIDIVIRDSTFMLTKPSPVRPGLPAVIVLRNEDEIRHGFTSSMLYGLLVHAEGEGVVSYGKGLEGFYVDPKKTLTVRFTMQTAGKYSFRCDLHPQMKGEFLMLDVQAV